MTTAGPIYLDCDTGIDDALTIAYLVARQADLVGIGTVCGNIDAPTGARNTLDLLELLGAPPIPVAVGHNTFSTTAFHGGAPRVHGRNGIGDVQLPTTDRAISERSATQLLSALAREHAGQLRVLAVGPLTNLAAALANDPDLPGLVRDVTIMGGAALAPGNLTPMGEANIANDPEAAAAVLAAGWDVTLVPLDVTMQQRITAAQADQLRQTQIPGLVALAAMLDCYFDFYVERYTDRAAALHDPLAAAIVLDDITLNLAPRLPIVVDTTHGPGRGQTIVDARGLYNGFPKQHPHNPRVALRIDDDFGALIVRELLASFTSR